MTDKSSQGSSIEKNEDVPTTLSGSESIAKEMGSIFKRNKSKGDEPKDQGVPDTGRDQTDLAEKKAG